MATKAELLADPDSCWNRAKDDEPLFILMARDAAAVPAIDEWNYWRGKMIQRGKKPESDWSIIQQAKEVVQAMIDWRAANRK